MRKSSSSVNSGAKRKRKEPIAQYVKPPIEDIQASEISSSKKTRLSSRQAGRQSSNPATLSSYYSSNDTPLIDLTIDDNTNNTNTAGPKLPIYSSTASSKQSTSTAVSTASLSQTPINSSASFSSTDSLSLQPTFSSKRTSRKSPTVAKTSVPSNSTGTTIYRDNSVYIFWKEPKDPNGLPSMLPASIQNLVRRIYAYYGQNPNLPLPSNNDIKLTDNQVSEAFNLLKELHRLLDTEDNTFQVVEVSDKLNALIHAGQDVISLPIISSEKILLEKYKLMTNYLLRRNASPIDIKYEELNCHIEPLDSNSDEYKRILTYVKNTQCNMNIQVLNVFKLDKPDLAARYRKFSGSLPNKKLLWHGTYTYNYVSILQHGLLTPSQTPKSSTLKGIYFSDAIAKSACYSGIWSTCSQGLLLLCEVALGNINNQAYVPFDLPPPGINSNKVEGSLTTDPAHSVYDNQVEIPCGPLVPNPRSSSCFRKLNEFIVYNPAQVMLKYLVDVNINNMDPSWI